MWFMMFLMVVYWAVKSFQEQILRMRGIYLDN